MNKHERYNRSEKGRLRSSRYYASQKCMTATRIRRLRSLRRRVEEKLDGLQ